MKNDLLAKAREKLAFDAREIVRGGKFTLSEINGAEKYAESTKPIIEALLKVVDVASQGVDGQARLVVPGDTWHERTKRALGELSQAVQDE